MDSREALRGTPRAGRSVNFLEMLHQEFVIRAYLRQGPLRIDAATGAFEAPYMSQELSSQCRHHRATQCEGAEIDIVPLAYLVPRETINPTLLSPHQTIPCILPHHMLICCSAPLLQAPTASILHLCETPFPVILLPSVPVVVEA